MAIRYEMVQQTRVIPLANRAHINRNSRSYMGNLRGHWEGDTLVVETTNFRDSGTSLLIETFAAYRALLAPGPLINCCGP